MTFRIYKATPPGVTDGEWNVSCQCETNNRDVALFALKTEVEQTSGMIIMVNGCHIDIVRNGRSKT